MRGIFLDVLEINIVVSCAIIILGIFSEPVRRRFGAKWMKAIWLILAVRLLIPYNFSLPAAQVRLLNSPGFEQEKTPGSGMPDGETQRLRDFLSFEAFGNLVAGRADRGEGAASKDADDGVFANMSGAGEESVQNTAPVAGQESQITEEKQQDADLSADGENVKTAGDVANPEMAKTPLLMAAGLGVIPGIWTELLSLCWLLGCLILSIANLAFYIVFRLRLNRSLLPVRDKDMKKQIYIWEREMLGKKAVPVFCSELIKSPMLTGYGKPMLLLPVFTVNDEKLRLVIRHELTHYQKRDLWGKLLLQLAWILNWFNPFVFWMKRQYAYDMEMACDSHVLRGKGAAVREAYARTMLSYAGKRSASSAFTTTFYGNKDRVKRRIDNMLDRKRKKNGSGIPICAAVLVICAGLLISCGYKPTEEAYRAQNGQQAASGEGAQPSENMATDDAFAEGRLPAEEEEDGVQTAPAYDVNNVYNQMIRYDGTYTYVSWEDGIYRRRDGEASFERIFEDHYGLGERRGMALHGGYLYFCGAAANGGTAGDSCIYRMDPDTLEAEQISEVMPALFALAIYEDRLYAAMDGFERIGFSMDEEGRLAERLDAEQEDFLYFTFNKERRLWLDAMNAGFDTEEYREKIGERNELYVPLIDPAWGRQMLQGDMVVSHYKDEYFSSAYLEKADGTHAFLCDYAPYPFLVTENGIYYFADDGWEIWYVDYETKTQRLIYEKPGTESSDINLCNYDADYLYYIKSVQSDTEQENGVWKTDYYLCRVLREGGSEEVLREMEEPYYDDIRQECAVAGEYFYFQEGEAKVVNLEQPDWKPEGLPEAEAEGGTEE